MKPLFKVACLAIAQIAVNTQEFTFERPTGFEFTAGQFLQLHWPEAALIRSYSLVSRPEELSLKIVVTFWSEGAASERLKCLQVGDFVWMSGPLGRFCLPSDLELLPMRLILISTGTGLAPYISMFGQLQQYVKLPQRSLMLLQGVQSPAHALYAQQLEAFARENANVSYWPCYSRSNLDGYFCGYVQDFLKNFELKSSQDLIYVCGNPKMVEAVTRLCLERHFPINALKREKYVLQS